MSPDTAPSSAETTTARPTTAPLPPELQRLHFVGIGGSGMSGVARIVLGRGADVSGSDVRDSAVIDQLRTAGAKVTIGHGIEALDILAGGPTAVVISQAAIPVDNPELRGARERGIRVLTRSEVLAQLAGIGRSILVAGTHGKTSTTSMLIVGAIGSGSDPSFAVGGEVLQVGTNARSGTDPLFIAEADESDGSLVHYAPDVVIVTNAEPDHLDHFHTAEAYYEVFDSFLPRIPADGALVTCLDDEGAAERARRAAAHGVKIVGYRRAGSNNAALSGEDDPHLAAVVDDIDVSATGTSALLTLKSENPSSNQQPGSLSETSMRIAVGIPGEHMALNAAAAVLAAREVGLDVPTFVAALAKFGGVGRRFELQGRVAGVSVYDDYAHHPTEVHAVLTAARTLVGAKGRVIAAFQPHLYSRTRLFASEFARSLSLADEVVVLDIFGAREKPEAGVSSTLITDRVTARVHRLGQPSELAATIAELAQAGDVVLTLGAGDITQAGPAIVAAIGQSASASAATELDGPSGTH